MPDQTMQNEFPPPFQAISLDFEQQILSWPNRRQVVSLVLAYTPPSGHSSKKETPRLSNFEMTRGSYSPIFKKQCSMAQSAAQTTCINLSHYIYSPVSQFLLRVYTLVYTLMWFFWKSMFNISSKCFRNTKFLEFNMTFSICHTLAKRS